MGFGDKKKGKGNGDDEDLPKGLRRDPNQSADGFIAGLAAKRQGNQLCPTCKGKQTVQVKREMDMGKGKVKMVMNTETCTDCGGSGWKGGRAR